MIITRKLIATWTADALTCKFFEIAREAIDEGSDENDCHELVGVESRTNVRRVGERFDAAYSRAHLRPEDDQRVDAAIAVAPVEVQAIMADYGWSG